MVHNARIRDTYVPIEESWLAEFQKRFPDYELPTSDIAPYSQFGAVIFFSCFETNLSDEDIWTIVEIIINDDDSDRELLYTKMRKKAAILGTAMMRLSLQTSRKTPTTGELRDVCYFFTS